MREGRLFGHVAVSRGGSLEAVGGCFKLRRELAVPHLVLEQSDAG